MYQLALFVLCLWVQIGHPAFELVNAVAAQIDGQPFSIQDAYLYRSLERVLSEKKPVVMIEKGEKLKKTIKKAVLVRLLLNESKEVGFMPSVHQTKKNFKSSIEPVSHAFGVSLNKLELMLNDIQIAEEFFKRKVASLTPLITELELKEYWQVNANRLKKSGLSAPEQVRNILQKEKRDKAIQDYVDYLSSKYSVVFFDL